MKAFLPFIIVGLCVGMYFMYISPRIESIKILNDKKDEYVSILEKAREVKVKRDAAIDAYNSIPEEDIARLDKVIPTSFDGVVMLNDLSAAVSRYGLTLVDFNSNEVRTVSHDSSAAEVERPKYKTISVVMRISGQYDQFIRFLKDIETNLQLVDVTSLSVTASAPGGARGNDTNLQYSLEFNTYALK